MASGVVDLTELRKQEPTYESNIRLYNSIGAIGYLTSFRISTVLFTMADGTSGVVRGREESCGVVELLILIDLFITESTEVIPIRIRDER